MYRHHGRPVSLFMLPKTRAPSSWSRCSGTRRDLVVGNRTFVLVAREPRAEVERMAAFVQASLH